jgi:hypothetical protein
MKLRNASFPFLFLALGTTILTTGCTMKNPLMTTESFSTRVDELLGGQSSVIVQAGRLTDFSWQKLCFRRHDQLSLEFEIDGLSRRVELPYEAFFVDEGHVPNSLEDACITPSELILVRRKYPGYSGPVEFQSTQTGSGG